MHTRTLGDGLEVSALGFGCTGLDHGYAHEQQNRDAAAQVIGLLGTIAERHDATPAQIALAWLLAQAPSIVPIPGTTKIHRLEENIHAASITVSDDDRAQLTEASACIDTSTARYPQKDAGLDRPLSHVHGSEPSVRAWSRPAVAEG